MSPTIIRASTAGFCMGVALALKKLNQCIKENPKAKTYTFGPIIHNPQVLEEYRQKGVLETNDPLAISNPAQVVIRAHGIPLPLENQLVVTKHSIIDATCPRVKKAQLLIVEQVRQDRTLLLFGEEDHPEVKGLLSYAGPDAIVFEDYATIADMELSQNKSYFLAAQTTQDKVEFEKIQSLLLNRLGHSLPVLDTICDATRQRQDEAQLIAQEADFMLVVGGRNSGNTRRLAQVVRETGTPCAHVETADEIPHQDLHNAKCIGLTAGASTPKHLIDEVEATLR